jgi:hypothetical protein
MNSRENGRQGERQWSDQLRANGDMARRGQQFSDSARVKPAKAAPGGRQGGKDFDAAMGES